MRRGTGTPREHGASGCATHIDTSNSPAAVSTAAVISNSSNSVSTRVISLTSGRSCLNGAYYQTREAPTRARGPSDHSTCLINSGEPDWLMICNTN